MSTLLLFTKNRYCFKSPVPDLDSHIMAIEKTVLWQASAGIWIPTDAVDGFSKKNVNQLRPMKKNSTGWLMMGSLFPWFMQNNPYINWVVCHSIP